MHCAKMQKNQTLYAIDHLAKTQKWQTAIMQRKKRKGNSLPSTTVKGKTGFHSLSNSK